MFALDGSEVAITAMEFDLLEAFASNPNRVLTRDELLELAHKGGSDPFQPQHRARLRQKIEPHPDKPQTIKTVRGAGLPSSRVLRRQRLRIEPTPRRSRRGAHSPQWRRGVWLRDSDASRGRRHER